MKKIIIFLLIIICFMMFSMNVFAFDINGVKLGSGFNKAKAQIKTLKGVDKRFGNDEDGFFEMMGMMFIPYDQEVKYFNHGGIAVYSDSNNKVGAIVIVGKDIDLIFDSYKLNAELLAKKLSKIFNGKAYLSVPDMNYEIKTKGLFISVTGDKSGVIISKFHQ